MKLRKVSIHKYKSYETEQNFDVDDQITILVGMNESGKTAALEAIAKTNYFDSDDSSFKYKSTHDYPRREKKKIDKSNETPSAVTCEYEIDNVLLKKIENDLGHDVLNSLYFTRTTKFDNNHTIGGIKINVKKFVDQKTKQLNISSNTLNEKLEKIKNSEDLNQLKSGYTDEKKIEGLTTLEKYFENKLGWKGSPLDEYLFRVYLKPNLPKFIYYDEYYSLPSRISIEKLVNGNITENSDKTAKALFELADINTDELLKADSFEDFIAELEATESIISDELFKYWTTNKNLQITFQIDKIPETDSQSNTRIIEHVLDIRVRNKGVSLPLKNRSKGFNWFFSFLVWFKKIQENNQSNYILLLDEPGLNLHASAQNDLLDFIEDLSMNYQLIYTTHSPFMISSESLNRVRTVLETDSGSLISESIQEKDPKTLFPLQAALGYDIAQNLYVSKKNLLVEGVADLVIFTSLSEILRECGRESLRDDITIVPTGGLEKVATFISLLRGSKLEIACMLDSYKDEKAKVKLNKMISEKIINANKIRFFDEFLASYNKADLEDLFSKTDYLKLFNSAFDEHPNLSESDLNSDIKQIIIQINQHLDIERFNHYRPAKELVKTNADSTFFEEYTLNNFENLFKEINKMFK